MVRYLRNLLVAAVVLAGAACNHGIDTTEAVREGVIDYLAKRSNIKVSAMNVDVTSVSFRQNEADATVSFSAKGAASAQPMAMRYTLERNGSRWVVKEKAESGNPHAGGATTSLGDLPPGHPVVPNPKQ